MISEEESEEEEKKQQQSAITSRENSAVLLALFTGGVLYLFIYLNPRMILGHCLSPSLAFSTPPNVMLFPAKAS